MSRAFSVSVSFAALAVSAALISCGGDGESQADSGPDAFASDAGADGPRTTWKAAPALPMAISNNAVGTVSDGGTCTAFSVLGITGDFANTDITNAAFRWQTSETAWEAIADAPGPPRIAANAVGVAGNLYVIGGYTVSAAGAEVSTDRVDMFNLATDGWEAKEAIPVPIDDTVAVAWQDRYIVVVSGWSNTANVDAVQIYDTQMDEWISGTAFPGTPAFGHAGGIVGDDIYIVDGAASTAGFPIVNQTWKGVLDPTNPTTITWTDLGAHVGPPRYRAAGGFYPERLIFIHGGTSTPYNFNGLRYDNGAPAEPLASTLILGNGGAGLELGDPKPVPTMDHRSLGRCSDTIFSVGGMVAGPTATSDVSSYTPVND